MQRAFKAGDLIFLGVALTLMIALTMVSYVIAPPQALELRGSTYSAGGEGAKAIFLLLKELGYTVERSYEPIAALHVEPSKTLLVLASPARRASLEDVRALRGFIEQGGGVIATGGGGSFLPEMGSVTLLELPAFMQREIQERQAEAGKTVAGPPAAKGTTYYAAVPSPITQHAPTVLLESEIMGTPPTPASYIPVYTDHNAAGVLEASFGDGSAVWMIGATPFLNAGIDKPGQLEFVLNLIGPPAEHRTVLWDEYYHGYDRGLLSYLGTTQLSTAFAQLGLIAVVALFTFSRRRGPLRPLLVRPRASAMEFVDAVSALYQKARAGSGAVETMRARLRRVLVTATQMPANSGDAQLAAAAATRYALDERELRDLLAASATASNQLDLPADEALSLVRRMQAAVRTMLARKTLE
jgi:hypothetical protein